MSGPWEDYAPAKAKRESGPWDDYGPGADKGLLERITDPFRQGASAVLAGPASTLKETGNEGVVSESARSTAKFVAPKDYTPANVTLDPRTWGDIPKALGESAPGMAVDLAAGAAGTAVGGPIVGLAAGVGSYGLRNYGDLLRRAVASSGDSTDREATGSEKARAVAASTLGGIASRLGLVGIGEKAAAKIGVPALAGMAGSPVTAAGGSVGKQIAGNMAAAGGREAVANVAQEGIEQTLVDKEYDTDRLGGALVTGAAGGAAFRAAASGKDIAAANKFRDITPEDAAPVVQRLQAAHGDDYQGTPKQDFEAVSKVGSDLDVRIKALNSDPNITGHLDALKKADPNDTTAETLGRVQADYAAGRSPAEADLTALQSTLGQFPHGRELLDTLKQKSTLDFIKSKGNYNEKAGTFIGGITGTAGAQKYLNPMGAKALQIDAATLAYGLLGKSLPGFSALHAFHSPWAALAVPGGMLASYAGLRGVDAVTGARSPTKQFLDRFTDSVANGPDTSGPTFMDVLAAQKAAAKAAKSNSGNQRAPRPAVQPPAAPQPAPAAPQPAPAAPQASPPPITPYVRPQAAPQPQAAPAPSPANAARMASLVAALNAQAPQQAPVPPTAAPVAAQAAPAAPVAPQAAPQAGPSASAASGPQAAPGTPPGPAFDIVTKHGTRRQLDDEVRTKRSNVENGVHTRAGAREDLMASAMEIPGLSQTAITMLGQNFDSLLRKVFNTKDQEKAMGSLEKFLRTLPKADRDKIRDHLHDTVDPSTGMTFYDTWS